MRVLFDQATPQPLREHLKGHTVRTAAQQGWDTLENGELLRVAEEGGFHVLLTTDKNMRYQQNLSGRRIAVIVLAKGLWPLIRPHVHRIVAAVDAAIPGGFDEVDSRTSNRRQIELYGVDIAPPPAHFLRDRIPHRPPKRPTTSAWLC